MVLQKVGGAERIDPPPSWGLPGLQEAGGGGSLRKAPEERDGRRVPCVTSHSAQCPESSLQKGKGRQSTGPEYVSAVWIFFPHSLWKVWGKKLPAFSEFA